MIEAAPDGLTPYLGSLPADAQWLTTSVVLIAHDLRRHAHKVDEAIHLLRPACLELFQTMSHIPAQAIA
jgi:hypothetical protein